MKESLKGYLDELSATFVDYGTYSKESVDYPDFAHAVALAVAVGHARQGIVIDGAGIGSAIAANKVPRDPRGRVLPGGGRQKRARAQ